MTSTLSKRFALGPIGMALIGVLAAGGGLFPQDPERDPCSATLLSSVERFAPGEPFLVGVKLVLDLDWHAYWESSRDGGDEPTVAWTLPPGFRAEPLRWPIPHRFVEIGDIVVYGYADEVWLPTRIHSPSDWTGPVTLKAHVTWQVCSDICIFDETDVSATVSSGKTLQASSHAKALEESWRSCPHPKILPEGVVVQEQWVPDPTSTGEATRAGTWRVRWIIAPSSPGFQTLKLERVFPHDPVAGGRLSEPECRELPAGADGSRTVEAVFRVMDLPKDFRPTQLGALIVYAGKDKPELRRAFTARGGLETVFEKGR